MGKKITLTVELDYEDTINTKGEVKAIGKKVLKGLVQALYTTGLRPESTDTATKCITVKNDDFSVSCHF